MVQVDSKTTRGLAPSLTRPIVERPRLMRLLDRSRARIRLLIAPAGYGKTTLADQWLADRSHAWYSCNAASSDVAGLAHGLAELIFEVIPELERTLRMHLKVAAQARDQTEHFTEVIVEHLEDWPSDVILAIDDHHLIAQSRDAEHLFDAIVEQTRVPLLITTRNRPAWASARNLLYGDVYEIDQKALSMTRAEAAALLTNKPAAVSRELIAMARGWPAIIALAWHADPRVLPRRSTALPEQLYQYIAEEIYGAASEETRKVLPLLAALHHWDIDLLRRAFGDAAADDVFADLKTNGFLTSATPRRTADFDLHPLIRAFLPISAASPASIADMSRGLTRELATQGRHDESVAVGVLSAEPTAFYDALRRGLYPLLAAGRVSTLRKWLTRARESGTPVAIHYLCEAELAYRGADLPMAEALARQSIAACTDDSWVSARAYLVAGRSSHLSHRDADAIRYFRLTTEIASDLESRDEGAWGHLVSASALQLPEVATLISDLSEPLFETPARRLRVATAIYAVDRLGGDLTRSLGLFAAAAPLHSRVDDPMIVSAFLHAYSMALAIAADYRSSFDLASQVTEYARHYRLIFALCHTHVTLASAQAGIGAYTAAEEALAQASKAAKDRNTRRFVELNVSAVKARIALMCGNVDDAVQLTTPRWTSIPDQSMWAEVLGTHALALALAGRSSKASVILEESLRLSRTVEVVGLSCATRAILSMNSAKKAESQRVHDHFEAATSVCSQDAFVVAYRSRPALAEALADGGQSQRSLFDLLLRAEDYDLAEKLGLRPTSIGRNPESPYGLTRREQELGQLLIGGFSNRELAEHLVLAESTVKLHLRHIYAKLDVRNRTEAVIKLMRERSHA